MIMGQRPTLLNFATLSERAEFIRNHPIGYRKDGRPILLIAGGSGEGDNDDDDDDDTSGGSGGSGGGGTGDTVSRAEFEALQRRMRAADRAKSAAEQRAEELEAAQRTELENARKRVTDLEKENGELQSTVRSLRVDNAFLTSSDVQWVDPEAALRLVDMKDVTIGDDGTVEGLTEALKKLAEKKPYLVKQDEAGKGKKGKRRSAADDSDEDDSDEDEDDDNDDTDDDQDDDTSGGGQGGGGAQGGASGTSTGSGKRRRKQKGPTDDELRARYRIY